MQKAQHQNRYQASRLVTVKYTKNQPSEAPTITTEGPIMTDLASIFGPKGFQVNMTSVMSPPMPRLQITQFTEPQSLEYLEDFGINLSAKNRHAPCPGCGGADRFRWCEGKDCSVYYHCAGAGEYTHGSAIDLVGYVYAWRAELIEDYDADRYGELS